MKRYGLVGAAIALCVLIVATASAFPPVESRASLMRDLTEKTLLNGMNCENCGLRASAEFMLGDLKVQKAVIPLMSILKGADDEQGRIIAALSLCKIGDARGVYAVKRAAQYDNSDRVRLICSWYYNEYVQPGTFRITYPESEGSQPIVER